jgi:hypothetical protein
VSCQTRESSAWNWGVFGDVIYFIPPYVIGTCGARPIRAGPASRRGSCQLPSEVAERLGRVLRLGPGADVTLFDGEGGEWQATIEMLERGRACVRVGGHRLADRESPPDLTLAQGFSRGERMDYTQELGVSRIVPIASERSVVRLSAERGERRTEHWARVVQAACEQSGRTRVPQLLPVATMDEWLSAVVPGLKLLLIPQGARVPAFRACPRSFHHLVDRSRRGLYCGGGQFRRAGRVPSAAMGPAAQTGVQYRY